MDMRDKILEALKWRYAVKVFDPAKKLDPSLLHTILESARLSPSSSGMELWKFLIVENQELRKKIHEASGQSKILDASHLIVITYRTDAATRAVGELVERTAKAQRKKPEELEKFRAAKQKAIDEMEQDGTLECWVRAQAYIPLGLMIETAALLGIDAGPMEGFDPEKVDEILNLKEKNLKSITMLALGYRGEDPAAEREKVRREFDEVVEFIS